MASHLPSWKATTYCSVTFKVHSPPASYRHSQLDKKGVKTTETLFSGISHARPMTQDATSRLLSFLLRTFTSLLQVGAPRNPSHLLKLLDTSSPRSVSQTIRQSHLLASRSHFSLVGSPEQVSPSWFPLADTHDQHRNPDSGSRAWKKHGTGDLLTDACWVNIIQGLHLLNILILLAFLLCCHVWVHLSKPYLPRND